MTVQEGAPQYTRGEELEARARLDTARHTIKRMVSERTFEPSLLSALEAAADGLHFIGTHGIYDSDSNERFSLLSALDAESAHRYDRLTGDLLEVLELTTTFPRDTNDLAAAVEDLLGQVVALLADIAREETPMNSDLLSGVDVQYVSAMTLRNSFNLWRRAAVASERAETAADAAAESAGETAEKSLAAEFETLHDKEKGAANWFRGITIALFFSTIVFTGYIAFSEPGSPSAETARKLVLAVPVLLLAGYLGRESAQHRRTARWAGVLVAQLKSIRAYSIELAPADRDNLKLSFGRRVFLDSPESPIANQEASSVTGDVPSVLREAAGLARASRGNP